MLIDILRLGLSSNCERRIIHDHDYERIAKIATQLHELEIKIALTSGSWDLFHVGHGRYLEKAKEMVCDGERRGLLIVGVDSDEKIRQRKGKGRPIVPEGERLEMLAHIRSVDLIFSKNLNDPPQALIKAVKPNVLVVSNDSHYSAEQLEDLRRLLQQNQGSLVILKRQAETTTSGRLRGLMLQERERIAKAILEGGSL